jgi:hypothetical protein
MMALLKQPVGQLRTHPATANDDDIHEILRLLNTEQ